MNKIKYFQNIVVFFALILTVGLSSAFGAVTITILNADAANVGFNDTTVVTPVGGNPGTTLGQQRLNAFQEAANIWGATLTSNTPIVIRATFTALTCTSTSAVLGSAGASAVVRDFPNAPFTNTLYGIALANKLADQDFNGATQEINANFNINLGNPGCLDGSPFYLGFDANEGTGVDLVAVLLHEFGHGLGFQTFTSGTTGAPNSGFFSVYDRFLIDNTTGKSWISMTNAERVASAVNSRNLAWDGPQVQTDAPSVLSLGTPLLKINAPGVIAGNYDVGTASFGPPVSSTGVTANIVQAVDPNDSAGTSTTDGCSPLTNAAAVSGSIALIDRGTCGFVVKVQNAQNAGAIAVVIADNVAGGPPAGLGGADPGTITIPSVRVTQATGNTVKAQLASGVNATLSLDNTVRLGADAFGKPLVYTPNPFQSGSSVSHWDTSAFPNLLMEPAINPDLTHQVTTPTDLTFSLFKDIGWLPSTLPNTIISSGGNTQTAFANQQFAAPLQVTVSPAVEGLIVTFTATATGGATGTFANSGSRLETAGAAVFLVNNSRAATAVTNASGVATSPIFSANGQAGTYTVNATVPGAGTTAFQLINRLAPTAATANVSGRVLTPSGAVLRGALVVLTKQNGETVTVFTNPFGYYNFANLPVNETAVMEVNSKRYRYEPRSLTLVGDLAGFNFTPIP